MKRKNAQIVRELGPTPGIESVAGVTFDGQNVWCAAGHALYALDPSSGEPVRSIDVPASAGTAFDGKHLFQIAGDVIRKLDAATGRVLGSIPTPSSSGCSGLAWAEGFLWIGCYAERKIHQLDPQTGKVVRTIESNRYVTGVTWAGDALWHGTWEDERSEIRRVEPTTGEVLEAVVMPDGMIVSGLESDGGDRFFCGGGTSGKVRIVRRPEREAAHGMEAIRTADAPSDS